MKIKKALLAAMAVSSMSLSSNALANDTVDSVKNAWTQCGIGAVIFNELPVAAAISNIIWDLGTTAVISMAASPETCKGVNVAVAAFINESAEAIESDVANGQGSHLTAMMALMGVEAENHNQVASQIRESFLSQPEVLSLTGSEKAQAIYVIAEKAAKIS